MDDGARDRDEKGREIGSRIVQARKELGGMHQQELAELIGVSQRSMQAYEQGEVIPYRHMRKLESVLNRPVGWILHGEEATAAKNGQLNEVLEELRAIRRLFEQRAG